MSFTAWLSLRGKTSPAPGEVIFGDGAFGMAAKFLAKVQNVRARQRLPPRGSWQNRQVLTEGVRSKPSREKAILENPQIFQNCEIKIILPLNMARAPAEAILNRPGCNSAAKVLQ